MNQRPVRDDGAADREQEPTEMPLGLGWSVGIERRSRGLELRLVHSDQQPLLVEIAVTAAGPVIRASARALEIDAAEDIVARCDRFAIEARESVSVRAREIVQHAEGRVHAEGATVDVVARAGDVRLRANDDVQVLGEQILLNCEREAPLPAWIPAPPPEATLPRQDEGGATDLLPPGRDAK